MVNGAVVNDQSGGGERLIQGPCCISCSVHAAVERGRSQNVECPYGTKNRHQTCAELK